MKRAGPLNFTSPGSLKRKSPRFSRFEAMTSRGIRRRRWRAGESRTRLVSKKRRMDTLYDIEARVI